MSGMTENQQNAYDITTKAIDSLYGFAEDAAERWRNAGLSSLQNEKFMKVIGEAKGFGFDGLSLALSDNRSATLAGIVAGKAAGYRDTEGA